MITDRPLSMTSFGQGARMIDGIAWTVEVRSVNHRYLDIHLKLPRRLAAPEDKVRRTISSFFDRGHVEVTVSSAGGQEAAPRLEADLALARQYHLNLLKIQQELSLPGAPDLALLASYRDVIKPSEPEEDLELHWKVLLEALEEALEKGRYMRVQEGAHLRDELLARLELFSEVVCGIEEAVPSMASKKQAALQERLDNLLQGVDIDPSRLAQEVAFLAEKADVTEELVRLRSHTRQFRHFLELDEPVGRRLDFLLQEFLREINTLASKIGDASLAHQTVELKNEVEKMREQVQNLE